jgi:hypothetical protein
LAWARRQSESSDINDIILGGYCSFVGLDHNVIQYYVKFHSSIRLYCYCFRYKIWLKASVMWFRYVDIILFIMCCPAILHIRTDA